MFTTITYAEILRKICISQQLYFSKKTCLVKYFFEKRNFDVIVVAGDTVILNETKATPKIEYINQFLDVLPEISDYFPEYQGEKLLGYAVYATKSTYSVMAIETISKLFAPII